MMLKQSLGQYLTEKNYLGVVLIITASALSISFIEILFAPAFSVQDKSVYVFRAQPGLVTILYTIVFFALGVMILAIRRAVEAVRRRQGLGAFLYRTFFVVLLILMLLSSAFAIVFTSQMRIVLSPDFFVYKDLYGSTALSWRMMNNIQSNPKDWYNVGDSTKDYAWLNIFVNRNEVGFHFPLTLWGNPMMIIQTATRYWEAALNAGAW